MSLGLIGKKIGMSQIFDENGLAVPVTVIQAGPCPVVQRKTSVATERVKRIKRKDGTVAEVKVRRTEGYDAVKVGFAPTRRANKPIRGEFGETTPCRVMGEFRCDTAEASQPGTALTVELFAAGEFVDVSGVTKGQGFQGVMKRHGFAGGPMTHGSTFRRAPGSIGQCAWPSKVFKGKKLPGRMGNGRVTMQNLRVVQVDLEKNLLLVKGSVPGPKEQILYIRKAVKKEAAK